MYNSIIILLLVTFVHSFALPQTTKPDDGSEPGVLIGDLVKKITTPTGQTIANILLGTETAQSQDIGKAPSNGGVAGCKKSTDQCCIWYSISADLTNSFKGPSGRCNARARMAIRLGFHDAGTWSKTLAAAGKDFGGADGSLVLFNEITRQENRGLEVIVGLAKAMFQKYKGSGISMADLIQYAATHAVVTCPLGPRTRIFVGRKDATKAAPDGLLPSVNSDADTLINLFQDKTISPHALTALLGAHSTSQQFFTSPNLAKDFGKPQDTTPGVWDVSFYNETIQPNPAPKTFRFASDSVIAKDPRSSTEWNAFIGDQSHWNSDYAEAYVRLSLLGVNNINNLTECTKTLPKAQPTFKGSTEGLVDQKKLKRRNVEREESSSSGCTR
ncbi:hypothetical protein HYALB_00007285 [Hymenoscyphus albidus]|uniref:Peroxidase n=1 Tax=Hymenoscyphus albidus TaxID=595503 RepID=A0A9N9M1V6_9HELO|nr:hypothetical protein HYALB_00007285 [Hymenoscyphus albidus]